VTGPGVTTANDLALFSGASASPAILAREGDASPIPGVAYGTLATPPALSSAGAVAFVTALTGATVTAADNSALFLHDAAGTRVLLREGDAAPGLAGVSIDFFGPPVIDASGRVALVAGLRGAVTGATNAALLVADPAGGVTLLLRSGDPFDTGAGVRTIDEIMLESEPATENGSAMVSIGAASRLMLKLHFKDAPGGVVTRSSGLFVATIGGSVACYPNCDGSTAPPILNVLDFNCFLNRFGAGDSYANCDGSTAPPVLNVLDFNCFLARFTAGCR
jgi:hypothetical protein